MNTAEGRSERTLVVHFMPEDGVGGAEVALRSSTDVLVRAHFTEPLRPYAGFVPDRAITYGRHRWWNPLAWFDAVGVLRRSCAPAAVFSLWKSLPVFLLTLVLHPRVKRVLLLHSNKTIHLPDKVASAVMISLAHEIWGDSQASLDLRVPARLQGRTRVITFVTRRLEAVTTRQPTPHFIFWGRMDGQKRVDEAIRLFGRIAACRPDARFLVIGRDGGYRQACDQAIQNLGIGEQVEVRDQMAFGDIAALCPHYSFFLQLSRYEGMSIAVTEAMQLGLVPVVTPVGEIARYCQDDVNAILVGDHAEAAERVLGLLEDEGRFARLREAAVRHWAATPLYRDDIRTAAAELAAGAFRPVGR